MPSGTDQRELGAGAGARAEKVGGGGGGGGGIKAWSKFGTSGK